MAFILSCPNRSQTKRKLSKKCFKKFDTFLLLQHHPHNVKLCTQSKVLLLPSFDPNQYNSQRAEEAINIPSLASAMQSTVLSRKREINGEEISIAPTTVKMTQQLRHDDGCSTSSSSSSTSSARIPNKSRDLWAKLLKEVTVGTTCSSMTISPVSSSGGGKARMLNGCGDFFSHKTLHQFTSSDRDAAATESDFS